VKENGVVLESARGPAPTFVDFVAGERVARWWSHPKGRLIFALTRALRDSPDVLTCRLIDHKITYVHRRLWPALVKLADKFDKADLAAIREEHLPNGKHQLVVIPFADWVPAEVVAKAKRLTAAKAETSLAHFFPKLLNQTVRQPAKRR
jgi:hypothetical protein